MNKQNITIETEVVKKDANSIVIQVSIPLTSDMLSTEDAIQQGVNMTGLVATEHALSRFDTDGTPIKVDNKKYTSKGQLPKTYQCPFGAFELSRHVYQSNQGGKSYCPLDNDARILVFSTPKFAKTVGHKYSQLGATRVQRDLKENHARSVSHTYIQTISDAIGRVASESPWEYNTEVEPSEVVSAGFSLDGTCMLLRNDGWRQAMVGSISLYDKEGERLHTTYLAQPPEQGKETFLRKFEKEIASTKKKYPEKTYIGIADGASDNWKFLQNHTQTHVLDFYHATEYLAKVAKAAFNEELEVDELQISALPDEEKVVQISAIIPDEMKEQEEQEEQEGTEGTEEKGGTGWLKRSCHTLKHKKDGAKLLLEEMKEILNKINSNKKKEVIQSAITYFKNHLHQMDYSSYLSDKIPIGSGVIEAACKRIVKQRMCNSGMRWTKEGAKNVLILRCFNETDGRWDQFWDKITKMGY